ncbi:hypothetical protein DOE59_16485 [Salmonella enterica subsp. diarizonae serovar 48:i:z]|uniref:Uncharacterized protein n=1 Tax=Salmonella enterica subsp. diarizonae serovar 48:i:z TaxID=1192842 RepID=A0A7U6BFK6_SALDZ|nr:hypothetical protein [Salmonella enterica]EAW1261861.1 hypothetical protein [Salmonella enterica subsp. diarizonae]AXC73021.1 hypothetical protein DOE59_16485 [Salmonella enterica subsp. diarizonae serovar 48:i:z]EAT1856548.1 hypothetical protein [Salmonella enterica]EEG1121504.1 hypothetical protein [Salmonella enterica subsp. diarizonae]EGU4505147.1 hypothetical protein [Salmonella enterica]
MITDSEYNAAQIATLMNAVAILASMLPAEKHEKVLFLLQGLADYDYDYEQITSDTPVIPATTTGQAFNEGYKRIIEYIKNYSSQVK